MLFEHLIYSIAIAIIAGMLWYKRTGRDPSWIIIASAYAPDFDIVAGEFLKKLDLNILTTPIRRADFSLIQNLLLGAKIPILLLIAGIGVFGVFSWRGMKFIFEGGAGFSIKRGRDLQWNHVLTVPALKKKPRQPQSVKKTTDSPK